MKMGYPDRADEIEILKRNQKGRPAVRAGNVLSPEILCRMQEEAAEIFETLKGKAVRVLISVADNERDILDQTKRLRPDVLHLCANFTGSPKFREKMREEIPFSRIRRSRN